MELIFQVGPYHTGLYRHQHFLLVDIEDPVHVREVHHDSAVGWYRATHTTGGRTPWGNRYPLPVAVIKEGEDLIYAVGLNDRNGHAVDQNVDDPHVQHVG